MCKTLNIYIVWLTWTQDRVGSRVRTRRWVCLVPVFSNCAVVTPSALAYPQEWRKLEGCELLWILLLCGCPLQGWGILRGWPYCDFLISSFIFFILGKDGLSWRDIWSIGLSDFGLQKEFASGHDWWVSKQQADPKELPLVLSWAAKMADWWHQNLCSWQFLMTSALLVIWD